MRPVASLLVLSLTALTVSGCGSFWRGATQSHAVAPSGLPWGEEFVRRSLVLGTFEQALARTAKGSDGAPDDALLRALFQGQVAYHAGRWEESLAAFAEAERLTDDRYTKSVTRGALSLVTSDHALHYVPPRTERLFARYYAMLARVQSGDVDGAAVDARRLSALLEEAADDLDPSEQATHAALREVAGAVFEAAGEWNDAGVAYRNAALLRGVPRASVDSIMASAPTGDSATVLLVVESGFVAHYVTQTLAIPMDGGMMMDADRRRRPIVSGAPVRASDRNPFVKTGERIPSRPRLETSAKPDRAPERPAPAAPRLPFDTVTAGVSSETTVSRWLNALNTLPDGGVFVSDVPETVAGTPTPGGGDPLAEPVPSVSGPSDLPGTMTVAADWTPRPAAGTRYLGDRQWYRNWMEIRWPSLVRSRLPNAPVLFTMQGVMATDSADAQWNQQWAVPLTGVATAAISDAVGADARRQRTARLARLTARTVTRAVAVDAVREKHGQVAGALAGIVASALERADTRAWHLLPGRLSVVRVTVPAGELVPAVHVGGGGNAVPLAMPELTARAGDVRVVTTRVWRDPG